MKRFISLVPLLLFALISAFLATAELAQGATVTVTNLNNDGPGSLRQAIANSSSGDTINFGVTGTITLTTGQLKIDKDLTISGPGAQILTISGNNSSRIFEISNINAVLQVNISGVTVSDGNNGGIRSFDSLTLENVIVTANVGGSGISNGGTLTLRNSTITGNTADDLLPGISSSDLGGGISSAGSLSVTNSTISDNTAAEQGGGIFITGSPASTTLVLTDSVVSGNTALGSFGGGGLMLSSGTVLITDSTISGNNGSSGGGITTFPETSLTINNGSLSGNTASILGGGIRNRGALALTNSTISGNNARDGGGMFDSSCGACFVTIKNVTITSNTASLEGGGIDTGNSLGGLTLLNTVVANNVAPTGPDCSGPFSSLGHNLVGNSTNCSFTAATGDLEGTGASPIDPKLGPLQDNGGPTFTHALLASSPAIDAGNPAVPGSGGNACEANDQRGVARPQGAACDIGAYEAVIGLYSITPGDAKLRIINAATGATLDDTITITLDGETVHGGQGLAQDPTTGVLWALLTLELPPVSRELVTIDSITGVATRIGATGDKFAGITFGSDGTLFGVTGDGASTPETLFTLNKTTAAPTLVLTLGNGDDGETIAYNPADGLIYHASGFGPQNLATTGEILETIDPNTFVAPTNVPLSGGDYGEAIALVYSGASFLLAGHFPTALYALTDSGVVGEIGPLDHVSKGLVVVAPSEVDPDSDGDGIPDSEDDCSGTAAGDAVDPNGCSQMQIDQDLDGICDPGKSSILCTGSDSCPKYKEDIDGVQDEDGCQDIEVLVILAETTDKPHEAGDNKAKYTAIFEDIIDYQMANSYESVFRLVLTEVMDNNGDWFDTGKTVSEYATDPSFGPNHPICEKANNFCERAFINDAIAAAELTAISEDVITVVASWQSRQDCIGHFLILFGCSESELPEERTTPVGSGKAGIILGNNAPLGHWAHEIGHALGVFLDGAPSCATPHVALSTVDRWDLMAKGGHNGGDQKPGYMSSYTREFLGWLEYEAHPSSTRGTFLINSLDTSTLEDLIFRLDIDTDRFYILEVRNDSDQYSFWDTEIGEFFGNPGKGLGIYYVDGNNRDICPDGTGFGWSVGLADVVDPPGFIVKDDYIDPDNLVKFTVIEELASAEQYELKVQIDDYEPAEGLKGILQSGGELINNGLVILPWLNPVPGMPLPDVDLHAFTELGQHIGMNYFTGNFVNEVTTDDEMVISGNSFNSREWILLPESVGEVRFYISSMPTYAFLKSFPELGGELEGETDSVQLQGFVSSNSIIKSAPVALALPVGAFREIDFQVIDDGSGNISVEIGSSAEISIDSLILELDAYNALGAIKTEGAYLALRKKLKGVKTKLNDGRIKPAINELDAFINQLVAGDLVEASARGRMGEDAQILNDSFMDG